MNEQKVQTLHNNSLEIFKQGQEMYIQVSNSLLSRTHQNVNNITHFETSAVRLSFGNEKVATDNFTRLKQLWEPIVQINAYQPNPKAKHLSAEDMGGLEPTVYLAKKPRVMLTLCFLATHMCVDKYQHSYFARIFPAE